MRMWMYIYIYILAPTKVIKSQRQPENLLKYSPLLHSVITKHKELPNTSINDAEYMI